MITLFYYTMNSLETTSEVDLLNFRLQNFDFSVKPSVKYKLRSQNSRSVCCCIVRNLEEYLVTFALKDGLL